MSVFWVASIQVINSQVCTMLCVLKLFTILALTAVTEEVQHLSVGLKSLFSFFHWKIINTMFPVLQFGRLTPVMGLIVFKMLPKNYVYQLHLKWFLQYPNNTICIHKYWSQTLKSTEMQAKYVAFPVPSLTLCYCMGFNNATCIIQEACCCLGYHYVMNFGGREEELNFLEKRHNYSFNFCY